MLMPFRHFNAPLAYQAMFNEVSLKYLDGLVVVYLDNIYIFSPDLESHQTHVVEVLDKIRENNLYRKASNYEFFFE